MPLYYHQSIGLNTRLAIWKIEEPEAFFDLSIPLQNDITHPHKRLQHLAARYLLPLLFSDFPNHEIEIATTRKPFLPNEQYHFSVSHCADYAAAIVSSRSRVGIDAETINPKIKAIKHKFLNSEELQSLETYNETDHLSMLSIAWSAKEAMYKWYGLGQVDFSNMMRLQPFNLSHEGIIHAQFIKSGFNEKLQVHYKLFEQIVLAWIA